jgi:hypothetical protein
MGRKNQQEIAQSMVLEREDLHRKVYAGGTLPLKQVISDLANEDRDLRVSALQNILSHPDPVYLEALEELRNHEEDPFVLSSLVLALGAVAREKSFPYLARYLKSPDGRVRANCIEAIHLTGASKERYQIVRVLLRFLSDPDRRVVTNCIKALERYLSKEELALSINDYFDAQNVRNCLNCLFLIYQLELIDNLYVFEVCLAHSSSRVREYCSRLLPLFQRKNPAVAKLQWRRSIQEENPVDLKTDLGGMATYLEELLRSSRTREKIDVLMGLCGQADHWRGKLEIASLVRSCLKTEEEPFVLSTLVKTLACLSEGNEWASLSPFLKHGDGRVVANTVEALVRLRDLRVGEFLERRSQDYEITDRENVRILSAGMVLLITSKPDLALEVMKKWSEGNITSVAAFVRYLNYFESPSDGLFSVVMTLVKHEVRPDILFELATFLEDKAPRHIYDALGASLSQVSAGEKFEILSGLRDKLRKKWGLEDEDGPADLRQLVGKVDSGFQDRIAKRAGEEPLAPFEELFLEPSQPFYTGLFRSPWFIAFVVTMLVFYLGVLFTGYEATPKP